MYKKLKAVSRQNERRRIIISEVNTQAGIITGKDSLDNFIYINFDFQTPFLAIPKVGQLWVVERYDTDWRLAYRQDQSVPVTPRESLSAGDYRVEADNDLYLNAENRVVINGVEILLNGESINDNSQTLSDEISALQSSVEGLSSGDEFLMHQGDNITSATIISPSHAAHKVTGSVQISQITIMSAGTKLYLFFAGTPKILHNNGGSGGPGSILFVDGIDHTMRQNELLILLSDGTSWYAHVPPSTVDGVVSSAGAIVLGSGFTVTKNGTGDFTVNYTTPFVARPVTSVQVVDGTLKLLAVIATPTASAFRVYFYNLAGTLTDPTQFTFLSTPV